MLSLPFLSQKQSTRVFFWTGVAVLVFIFSGCTTSETNVPPPAETATPVEHTPTQAQPTATSLPAESPTATPMPTATPTAAPTFTPTATSLPTLIEGESGVPMVLVPAGEFIMGSDNNQAAAQPAHTVYLDSFYIDQYEVTNGDYLTCAEAGVCTTGGSFRIRRPELAQNPVVFVNWNEAKTFCEWRGARLPTEAEWEKAARGTDQRIFPWGNDPITCDRAQYNECDWALSPVGSYPSGVSPYGAYDMAGNAWEWVSDWYAQDYYSYSPAENPTGPESGLYKSTRGGGFLYDPRLQTTIWRNQAHVGHAYIYLGFRCARTP